MHQFTLFLPDYVYLLGLYLGDGSISTHARGVFRLRVTLDQRYPGIIQECARAMRTVTDKDVVGSTPRTDSACVDVSCYWKCWPCLFPQHGPGRKHHRRIVLTDWQETLVERWPEMLLRGLVHSDGCRFINTGRDWRHPRYGFSNRSEDIRGVFCATLDWLGVHCTAAPHTIYVSRKADVARLDLFIGPKS